MKFRLKFARLKFHYFLLQALSLKYFPIANDLMTRAILSSNHILMIVNEMKMLKNEI